MMMMLWMMMLIIPLSLPGCRIGAPASSPVLARLESELSNPKPLLSRWQLLPLMLRHPSKSCDSASRSSQPPSLKARGGESTWLSSTGLLRRAHISLSLSRTPAASSVVNLKSICVSNSRALVYRSWRCFSSCIDPTSNSCATVSRAPT